MLIQPLPFPATVEAVIGIYGSAIPAGLALGAVCALLASLVGRGR